VTELMQSLEMGQIIVPVSLRRGEERCEMHLRRTMQTCATR